MYTTWKTRKTSLMTSVRKNTLEPEKAYFEEINVCAGEISIPSTKFDADNPEEISRDETVLEESSRDNDAEGLTLVVSYVIWC